MSRLHPADQRARSARKRLRRRQRKVSTVSRVFETIAALIPTMVLLMHLSLKAAEVKPEQKDKTPLVATTAVDAARVPAAVPITAVPEPSTAAILGVGGAFLLLRNRQKAPAQH